MTDPGGRTQANAKGWHANFVAGGDLAKRVANVPTSGSWRVDRLLVVFAERLALEASVLEQENNSRRQIENGCRSG